MMKSKTSENESLAQVLVDLCASFISTNGVKIEYGYPVAQKLLDGKMIWLDYSTAQVGHVEEGLLWGSLVAEKFPRGEYVARLVSQRISRAFEQINQQGGLPFLIKLKKSNFKEVSSLLIPLYGVGSKFVDTYCLLAGIGKNSE